MASYGVVVVVVALVAVVAAAAVAVAAAVAAAVAVGGGGGGGGGGGSINSSSIKLRQVVWSCIKLYLIAVICFNIFRNPKQTPNYLKIQWNLERKFALRIFTGAHLPR